MIKKTAKLFAEIWYKIMIIKSYFMGLGDFFNNKVYSITLRQGVNNASSQ